MPMTYEAGQAYLQRLIRDSEFLNIPCPTEEGVRPSGVGNYEISWSCKRRHVRIEVTEIGRLSWEKKFDGERPGAIDAFLVRGSIAAGATGKGRGRDVGVFRELMGFLMRGDD